jgi:fumarate hydratase subunit alpha
MREIHAQTITDALAALCVSANRVLPGDVERRIRECRAYEPWPQAGEILGRIVENMELAGRECVPICQDTGAACVFVELGQDAHVVGGSLGEAIHEGVRKGYADGYLRKSIVADPLRRVNTGDNTPAMITWKIVPGDKLRLILAPKGFGSENMSRVKMLAPSAGVDGVIDFVVETVELAGPNPCPPVVLGVGIGGNFDKVAALAKQALLRPLDAPNPDPYYAALEGELLARVNALGVGPQGFGGATTALAANIEVFPTHIAGLPVAVNMSCHVTRRGEVVL